MEEDSVESGRQQKAEGEEEVRSVVIIIIVL